MAEPRSRCQAVKLWDCQKPSHVPSEATRSCLLSGRCATVCLSRPAPSSPRSPPTPWSCLSGPGQEPRGGLGEVVTSGAPEAGQHLEQSRRSLVLSPLLVTRSVQTLTGLPWLCSRRLDRSSASFMHSFLGSHLSFTCLHALDMRQNGV